MSHTEGPDDNVDHVARHRDVMADVADFRREVRELRTERDAAVAILRRFVNFSKEMPSDIMTCLDMGNRISADAEAFLKRCV